MILLGQAMGCGSQPPTYLVCCLKDQSSCSNDSKGHTFNFMKDYNTGISARWFKEIAEKLHYAVLTNKQYQEKRFVRATLHGLQAGLRNLPIFYNIQGKSMQEAMSANDNLYAGRAKKKLDQL